MTKLHLSRRALALAAVPILASCNRDTKKRIGVVPKGRAHLFWQSVHAGANKAAGETGVEVEWNGPASETDFNGQLQIVEAMINKRLDAIVLAPIDKKVMVSVVERATRANIPVVIFDCRLTPISLSRKSPPTTTRPSDPAACTPSIRLIRVIRRFENAFV